MNRPIARQKKPSLPKNGAADLPLSLLLFRYLWPFWLFKNASRGDRLSRAAAYRHNRDMRVYLPGYLLKWAVSTAFAWLVAIEFDSLSSSHVSNAPDMFLIMAAGAGMLFACGLCVLSVTAYVYLYLCRHTY